MAAKNTKLQGNLENFADLILKKDAEIENLKEKTKKLKKELKEEMTTNKKIADKLTGKLSPQIEDQN